MRGMIFAAGLGTRLRPLTDHRPKALMEVGGVTALGRVAVRMREAGMERVVVNVHHLPQMVREDLRRHHGYGLEVAVSDESALLLDTGGGLLRALPLLGGEAVVLHNADVVTDFPLREMMESHRCSGADVTLLTSAYRPSGRKLLFDGQGRMHGWKNAATGEVRPPGVDARGLVARAFGGVHIVEPRVFGRLEAYGRRHGEVFSITQFYIEACRDTDIRCYEPTAPYRWFDIGSPEKLRQADEAFGG